MDMSTIMVLPLQAKFRVEITETCAWVSGKAETKKRNKRKQETREKQPSQKLTTWVRSSQSVVRINETTVKKNDHQALTSSASVGYSLRVQKLQGCKNMWTTTYSQKSQGKRIMSKLVLSLCFEAKSAGHCRFCVSSSLFPKIPQTNVTDARPLLWWLAQFPHTLPASSEVNFLACCRTWWRLIAPVRNVSMRPAYVGAIEGATLQLWPRLGRRKLSTEKPQNGLDDGRLGTGDIMGALALEHLQEAQRKPKVACTTRFAFFTSFADQRPWVTTSAPCTGSVRVHSCFGSMAAQNLGILSGALHPRHLASAEILFSSLPPPFPP